jgi:hypothetical protein
MVPHTVFVSMLAGSYIFTDFPTIVFGAKRVADVTDFVLITPDIDPMEPVTVAATDVLRTPPPLAGFER